jgi:N6-L-threonylcarbamoyladenine synthase
MLLAMKILAIETSCDETALALFTAIETDSGVDFDVHKVITHSQIDVHREYGGVFPKLAKREHEINLPIILDQIMEGQEPPDYICVTSGPGLEPALWTGITFAKELGGKWKIPVVPVNHMEGHIVSVFVPEAAKDHFVVRDDQFHFPALALLISGGHTELVIARAIGEYEKIGKTRDDAVGEAFDKVARILGLPYPGGPEVSKLATQFTGASSVVLPRPMIHSHDFDFSFSGLKTAVLYMVKEHQPLSDDMKIAIAHEFQEAAAEVLVKKTVSALKQFGAQTLIVGGGVSANGRIKELLTEKASEIIPSENIYFPIRELTGDNALMIGLAGYYKIKNKPDAVYTDIRADGNLAL